MRIANKNAASYVGRKVKFTGSNLYARENCYDGIFPEDPAVNTYTVYSYGEHFPIYVYDHIAHQWFGNEDKYSLSTSRHQRQACPCSRECITWVDTDALKKISRHGVVGLVTYKLAA